MSRHRNIRSKNFSEEYEGYDDELGHSVEDDFCISPSVEQFLYDRNRRQQMSAFLGHEEEIAEEDEDEDMEKGASPEHGKTDLKSLNLNDIDQARLMSCLEEVRNVIGDSVSEQSLIDAALSCDFNFEKVLNLVLNNATEKDSLGALKPTKADTRKDKDDCSSCNAPLSPSDSQTHILITSDSTKQFTPLSESIAGAGEIFSSGIHEFVECSPSLMKSGFSGTLTPEQTKTSDVKGQEGGKMEASGLQGNKTGCLRAGPQSDFGLRKSEMDSHSSDSEEDNFSSLCSLVIHNRKRLSDPAASAQKSPSGVPSLPLLAKVPSGNSTPAKPLGFCRGLGQIDSESEDDDFSSLQSLVVHNRSGLATPKSPSNPVPPFSLSNLTDEKKNLENPVSQETDPAQPNKSSDDSDSEDFNFSSLCSLVIRNRSHQSDDGARASSKDSGSFSNVPEKKETKPSPVASGKAVPLNIPSLGMANVRDSNIAPKLPAFCNKSGGDSDSDTEEEDFSSLCSLVIHNRNNPSVPGAKVSDSPSFGSPLSRSLEKEMGTSPGLNKFIIPPLVLQKSSVKSIEMEVDKGNSDKAEDAGKIEGIIFTKNISVPSTDGSNQCSEDEDYVIDLCSTVKAVQIEPTLNEMQGESSFEEDVDELQISKEAPIKLVMDSTLFLPSLNVHDERNGTRGLKPFQRVSPFGQTLCRRWGCLVRREIPPSAEDDSNTSTVEAFVFESESPDDMCRRLRSTKYLVKVESPNVAA